MNEGRFVFSQVLDFVPQREFRRLVEKHRGDYKVVSFSCWDQFLCMVFAQLTFRESLREIEDCLRPRGAQLYHLGLRGNVSRSTLAYANATRDWKIYQDFALILIHQVRMLYADEPLGVEIDAGVYAIDSTTVDLCLSLFPWARFRKRKAAVKFHTLLDIRVPIPTCVYVSDGKLHDVNWLDDLCFEEGSFYILDRGYVDFARLFRIAQSQAFFVTRAKSNFQFQRVSSRPVEPTTGVLADQIIRPAIPKSQRDYPEKLRRIKFYDAEQKRVLVFLTNNFELPASTIAALYKSRWRIELFFKWLKQNLRIKNFSATIPTPSKLNSGAPSPPTQF